MAVAQKNSFDLLRLLADRWGDLSYGMYIFAFPVQQVLAEVGRGRNWAFSTYLGLAYAITIVLAYCSWHLIGKRALRFKPRSRLQA